MILPRSFLPITKRGAPEKWAGNAPTAFRSLAKSVASQACSCFLGPSPVSTKQLTASTTQTTVINSITTITTIVPSTTQVNTISDASTITETAPAPVATDLESWILLYGPRPGCGFVSGPTSGSRNMAPIALISVYANNSSCPGVSACSFERQPSRWLSGTPASLCSCLPRSSKHR